MWHISFYIIPTAKSSGVSLILLNPPHAWSRNGIIRLKTTALLCTLWLQFSVVWVLLPSRGHYIILTRTFLDGGYVSGKITKLEVLMVDQRNFLMWGFFFFEIETEFVSVNILGLYLMELFIHFRSATHGGLFLVWSWLTEFIGSIKTSLSSSF